MARKDEDSFWFKFYPDKYLGGTAGFSLEMHGAYLILLLHQNASGPFVEEVAISLTADVWTKIRHKFLRLNDGRFINIRMDQESQHRKEICETNRENIRKRYDGSTTVPTTVPTTVVRPSSSSSSSSSELNSPTMPDVVEHVDIPPEHVSTYTDMSGQVKTCDKRDQNPPDEFKAAKIYAAYPRHVARKPAMKAILAAMKKIDALELWNLTLDYATSVEGKDPTYIPHPATWYNAERWKDVEESPETPENPLESL